MKIAPSILAADFSCLEKEIKKIEPYTDIVHIDVMDGVFVPNISFGFPVIDCLRGKTSLLFDTHLMIEDPIRYVERFAASGSDYITIHYEACKDVKETIKKIHECGKKAGISINPETPVEVLLPYFEEVDLVLIMSVSPGFGGQKFLQNSIEKIRYCKNYQEKYHYLIEVDGGINQENYSILDSLGVDIVVMGSYIFKSKSVKDAFSIQKK